MTQTYAAAFDWARQQVDAGALPTAVLGIADRSGVVALDAFGHTEGRPATVDDHYFLWSITKVLVGLTAARAIERGLVTPQTPLTDALPPFGRDRDDAVLLRHLVSHTAGIPEPALDHRGALREALLAPGRDFAAGTMSRYSSVAFEGVAALLEHAAGSSWESQLGAWTAAAGADGVTLDTSCDPHAVPDASAKGVDMSAFAALRHPGAGAMARASDLLAIGSALLREGDEIIAPATLAMMRRPLTGDIPRLEPYPAERGQDWGFTWNLRSRAPGLIDTDVYGHGGWAGTEFWIHPRLGVAYVLLTNRAERPGVDADRLDNAVAAAASR
ncbi:serine hydrolase domain-containing protein [Microbacterium xanthum]|uniref:serine hydrolase domain-containing protein n=1 Tax=Microbacterium xanthum TaxID=3079794 RepID=UPI002AD21334|nr:serine hydrolase domain-containing protein [Microbacterium sp. KSW-48]MDZ8170563.1 serine hydrolase domain-containing protein [Microbacterium sp. KSW-48]